MTGKKAHGMTESKAPDVKKVCAVWLRDVSATPDMTDSKALDVTGDARHDS